MHRTHLHMAFCLHMVPIYLCASWVRFTLGALPGLYKVCKPNPSFSHLVASINHLIMWLRPRGDALRWTVGFPNSQVSGSLLARGVYVKWEYTHFRLSSIPNIVITGKRNWNGGNGNKTVEKMGMGMRFWTGSGGNRNDFMGMSGNGNNKSHSRTHPLLAQNLWNEEEPRSFGTWMYAGFLPIFCCRLKTWDRQKYVNMTLALSAITC